MAARTYVNDAGTWRRIRNIYVNDAGVWRQIRRAYVNDAGTWRTVFDRGEAFTLTAGQLFGLVGYGNSASYGSFSITSTGSATLPDGRFVEQLFDNGSLLALSITGFVSDPGAGYLSFIEIGSSEYLASAASYSFAAGQANWTWSTSPGFVNGNVYSGLIAVS
jgi:hypothetical protein